MAQSVSTSQLNHGSRKLDWRKWFGRAISAPDESASAEEPERTGGARRTPRQVVAGLPRAATYKRQESERRDKLEPAKADQRTHSVDPRRRSPSHTSPRSLELTNPRLSAPGELGALHSATDAGAQHRAASLMSPNKTSKGEAEPTAITDEGEVDDDLSIVGSSAAGSDIDLLEELQKCWILNLSMHFRDRSNREKFFVTYAETPTCWRRVTISLDYRDACPGSLEVELQKMQYQRDKSARIYESIRESLSEIQFYDTVTNLKLKTENDRLHVHVVEDVHEIINFPPVASIAHLECGTFREDELKFDSHLSGFVYKVTVNGKVYIKKEIPGPDTIEEFLYEINALHALKESTCVIDFGGVVTSNDGALLKGLLISYAEKGALIDVIYDGNKELSWSRRERWAMQIVKGLSEIHEAGFVQGDFTLSNIVIDSNDDAKIIDINRRGCPVGWEPPEILALLNSKQRISLFIGQKTDMFQLGMVLWALAMQLDEPELEARPLIDSLTSELPRYYGDLVRICLDDSPKRRSSALTLLHQFPRLTSSSPQQPFLGHKATLKDDNGRLEPNNCASTNSHEDLYGIDSVKVMSSTDGQAPNLHSYECATAQVRNSYNDSTRGRSITVRTPEHADYSRDEDIISTNTNDANSIHDQQDAGLFQDLYADRDDARRDTRTTQSRPKPTTDMPIYFGSTAIHSEQSRATRLLNDDILGDLRGVGMHSTTQHHPQVLGDDDLSLES